MSVEEEIASLRNEVTSLKKEMSLLMECLLAAASELDFQKEEISWLKRKVEPRRLGTRVELEPAAVDVGALLTELRGGPTETPRSL